MYKLRLTAIILSLLFLFGLTSCAYSGRQAYPGSSPEITGLVMPEQSPTTEPEPEETVYLAAFNESTDGSPARAHLTGSLPADTLDALNNNLDSALSNLYKAVSDFGTSPDRPVLAYSLISGGSGVDTEEDTAIPPKVTLEVSVLSPAGRELSKILFSADTGTAGVSLLGDEFAVLMADPDLLHEVLKLSVCGINVSSDSLDAPVNTSAWVDILTETYEYLAGSEIDASEIINKGTLLQRKAMAIDLIEPIDIELDIINYPLSRFTAIDKAVKLYERAGRYLFADINGEASANRALELINDLGSVYTPDFLDAELDRKIKALAEQDQPLTKLAFARILVTIDEYYSGSEITYKYDGWVPFDDVKDSYAEKAAAIYMPSLGSRIFGPDEVLRVSDIYQPVAHLVNNVIMNDFYGAAEGPVTRRQLIDMAYRLLSGFDLDDLDPIEEKTVINERPYDWYVSQYKTGDYGYVNCMPASMEMVMNWRDNANTVTTEQLREEYFNDGQGWFDIGLANMMERYHVPYTLEWDVSAESMMRHLDDGNVLIVMYRSKGAPEGHAVVVKGYKASKAGVWFVVNDPASYNEEGKYGVPDGINRELESQQLIEDIVNHSLWYLVIPPAENEN